MSPKVMLGSITAMLPMHMGGAAKWSLLMWSVSAAFTAIKEVWAGVEAFELEGESCKTAHPVLLFSYDTQKATESLY